MVTTTTKISLGYELYLVQSSPSQNAILHVCQNSFFCRFGWHWFGFFHLLVQLTNHFDKFISSKAEKSRQWNASNKSQRNPVARPDETPCTSTSPTGGHKLLYFFQAFFPSFLPRSLLGRRRRLDSDKKSFHITSIGSRRRGRGIRGTKR